MMNKIDKLLYEDIVFVVITNIRTGEIFYKATSKGKFKSFEEAEISLIQMLRSKKLKELGI